MQRNDTSSVAPKQSFANSDVNKDFVENSILCLPGADRHSRCWSGAVQVPLAYQTCLDRSRYSYHNIHCPNNIKSKTHYLQKQFLNYKDVTLTYV